MDITKLSKQEKIIYDLFTESWIKYDVGILDHTVSNVAVINGFIDQGFGIERKKKLINHWFKVFTNKTEKITSIFSNGDIVFLNWEAEAVYKDDPIGNFIKYSGICSYKMQNNKVINYKGASDIEKILGNVNKLNYTPEKIEISELLQIIKTTNFKVLTKSEIKILSLLSLNKTSIEIAKILGLSIKTVENIKYLALEKLDIKSHGLNNMLINELVYKIFSKIGEIIIFEQFLRSSNH